MPTRRPGSASRATSRSGKTPNAPSTTMRSKGPRPAAPLSSGADDHDDVHATVKFGLGRLRRARVGFEQDDLRAHGGKDGRAIAGAARDIERAVAGDDRRRLEHPRQDHGRQQPADLGATRRQFAIEIGERRVRGRYEALARHLEERRQHGLIDHSAGAHLAVDHMQAPVKHRVSGNVRPLGSDPRFGTDRRPR